MLTFILKSDLAHTLGYIILVLVIFSFLFEKVNWLFKTNIYKKYYKVKSFNRQFFLSLLYLVTLYCGIFEICLVLTDSQISLYLLFYMILFIPFSLYFICTKLFNKIIEFRNKLPD